MYISKNKERKLTLNEELFEQGPVVDDFDDMNTDDIPPITKEEQLFAESVYDLIQHIIDSENRGVEEAFTSKDNLENHYDWHCLAGKKRISSPTNIFYDFDKLEKYKDLENKINGKFINALRDKRSIQINSLYDVEDITKGFRKLFEGDFTLVFSSLCGFKNLSGPVTITFVSFASDCTQNYKTGNSIHCLVSGRNTKTVTLYPIDANYVENKFNSFIRKYNNVQVPKFIINMGH